MEAPPIGFKPVDCCIAESEMKLDVLQLLEQWALELVTHHWVFPSTPISLPVSERRLLIITLYIIIILSVVLV